MGIIYGATKDIPTTSTRTRIADIKPVINVDTQVKDVYFVFAAPTLTRTYNWVNQQRIIKQIRINMDRLLPATYLEYYIGYTATNPIIHGYLFTNEVVDIPMFDKFMQNFYLTITVPTDMGVNTTIWYQEV